MSQKLEWFIKGVKAWIVLAPDSRPEKYFRKIVKIFSRSDDTAFLLRGVKSHVEKRKKEYSNYWNNKYILYINTSGSEKYTMLILDVFLKLSKKYKDIHLVIAGKLDESIKTRINQNSMFKKRVTIYDNFNENDRIKLYQNAYLCITFPAYREDYVVLEDSLAYGNITVTSKVVDIYKIAEQYADYIVYDSFNELYETIKFYLDDPKLYFVKKKYIIDNFVPYLSKKESGIQFNPLKKEIQNPDKLQFVFISIDIDNIKETIQLIDEYMDFVESYLIITSEELYQKFKEITSVHDITIINENKLLDEDISIFKKRDHQTKNWILRASLLKINSLHDQFIMLDDDNRPLGHIGIEHFIENGKYNAYFYYDLTEWHNCTSDYDFGQHNTRKILKNDGLELLSYSSHKPQIIDKSIFQEVVDRYYNIGIASPIDEWSIYFNYATLKYPHLFNKKKFDVLNWPDHPSSWNWIYTPDCYNFENYYARLYANGIFKDHKNLTTEKKISMKGKELLPYRQTYDFFQKLQPYYGRENTVHGVLKFSQDEKQLFCYGLPYYYELIHGTSLKISLNYKALSFKRSDNVQLICSLGGNLWSPTSIYIGNDTYFEEVAYFTLDVSNLDEGEYTVLVDLFVNGIDTYGNNSPYMIKLKVL